MDLTVKQLLRQIGLAYRVFLEDGGLQDTPLARMTYFSAVKKEYLKRPLESGEDQAEILLNLERWLEETNEAMVNAMQRQKRA